MRRRGGVRRGESPPPRGGAGGVYGMYRAPCLWGARGVCSVARAPLPGGRRGSVQRGEGPLPVGRGGCLRRGEGPLPVGRGGRVSAGQMRGWAAGWGAACPLRGSCERVRQQAPPQVRRRVPLSVTVWFVVRFVPRVQAGCVRGACAGRVRGSAADGFSDGFWLRVLHSVPCWVRIAFRAEGGPVRPCTVVERGV